MGTAQFRRELDDMRDSLRQHGAELDTAVAEACDQMLRLVANHNASSLEDRLKALEDDKFVQETLPKLRQGNFDFGKLLELTKPGAEMAKVLAPLSKLLTAGAI